MLSVDDEFLAVCVCMFVYVSCHACSYCLI